MSPDNLDTLGYIPFHIPTDPLDPELDTFRVFVKTMDENSVHSPQGLIETPFSACVVPDTIEGRRALVDKVFFLFEEELKKLRFSKKQISDIKHALETLVPDSSNVDFEFIFQDRVCGFLQIMEILRKLFFATGERNVVVAEAQRLSAKLFGDYVGAQAVLAVLPHEQFRALLYPKTGRLSCLTELLQLSPHFRIEQLDPILTAYFNKISEIGLNEQKEWKFRRFLISKLHFFDAKRPDLDLHLEKLTDRLETVKDEESLTKAIGQFGGGRLNISLTNGSNGTEAHNLPELFGELNRADRLLGERKPAGYSVVPASTSKRNEVRQRIADLFNTGVEDENLCRFLTGNVELLLDTADPCFDEVLTDRDCGVIELLRLTYNDAIKRNRNIESAIIGFRRLIEGATGLPWKSRNGEQSRREVLMERLEKRRAAERLVENAQCFDALCCRMNRTADLLREIRASFLEAAADLDINFDMSVQWFRVFIGNLNSFVVEKNTDEVPGLEDALSDIKDVFESATEPREVARAIDTFAQRTLPALLRSSQLSE
ncbi:hypothetical protein HZC21_02410 [Candidatus Peregrinibacteria bacterium]|nr:hypothetical protein [Candidatus Peregrinibacteria bacterium]